MDPDDFRTELSETAKRHYQRVQANITHCMYCQPSDEGECVWILGMSIDLEELLDALNVPEKHRDSICENLVCPWCGRSGFDRCEAIGIQSESEKKHEEHVGKARRKYGKQVDHLRSELEESLSLALATPIGAKL